MKENMITAIIPAYNEEKNISHVIEVVTKSPLIDEVIVVNDGSTDNTEIQIKKFLPKIIYIKNEKNLGKGGAVVEGIKKSTGDILLFCDADLRNIKECHLKILVNTLINERFDMVVIAPGPKWSTEWFIFRKYSGQRIVYKKNIESVLEFIAERGYGMEAAINHAHKNKSVKYKPTEDFQQFKTHQRYRKISKWLPAYAYEAAQIIQTHLILKTGLKILSKIKL